jgi:K+-transporting ATPase ATPase A chain
MTTDSFGFVVIFLITLLLALPTGAYMKRVYNGESSLFDFLAPFESWIFKKSSIDPKKAMDWKQYMVALLTIQIVWVVPAFIALMLQGKLFLNPAHIPGMEWPLALNSAISFLTSTNLQHYSGETGATYFLQIAVFTFLQFVSAATSLAAGVAIVRGLTADPGTGIGNFLMTFCGRLHVYYCPCQLL